MKGRYQGPVVTNRGLQQGWPLSLYLFLLCEEGFTAILTQVEYNKELMSFAFERACVKVSHICFVDDYLEFCRGNT